MTQATEQPQGQMISGHYVAPSWSQQIAPLAKAAIGTGLSQSLDEKQLKLAEALRIKKGEELSAFQELMSKPETRGQAMQYAAKSTTLQPLIAELMKPQKLGEGENIVMPNLGGGEPLQIAGGGIKRTTDQKDYELAKSQGFPGSFIDFQMALKRAGAPSTTVNMGKSIAGEIGPMMKEAQGIAQAAVKTEDSANRIIQAVDSNKLFTGSGANVRFGVAQLANTLGVGGATLEAKIANTRQTMQGLAELTLQGRQQMRGQGAITESESKLAERAISGEITFTPTEIKQLANAAKRSADYAFNSYQSKIGEMSKNPDTAGLVPYYQVQKMTPSNAMPNQSAIDAEIARRQGKR